MFSPLANPVASPCGTKPDPEPSCLPLCYCLAHSSLASCQVTDKPQTGLPAPVLEPHGSLRGPGRCPVGPSQACPQLRTLPRLPPHPESKPTSSKAPRSKDLPLSPQPCSPASALSSHKDLLLALESTRHTLASGPLFGTFSPGGHRSPSLTSLKLWSK